MYEKIVRCFLLLGSILFEVFPDESCILCPLKCWRVFGVGILGRAKITEYIKSEQMLRNLTLAVLGRCWAVPLTGLLHSVSAYLFISASRIIELNNSSPPLSFKRFQALVQRLELPKRPLPTVTAEQMDGCSTPIAHNHNELYSVPSLEELGENLGD